MTKQYWITVGILWWRDLLHYWRNRVRAIVGLTMPMLWLFIFGGGMSSTFSQRASYGDINYVVFIFPGIIAMSLIFNAIFSALNTVKDKEVGFLKEILVAPVLRSTIVLGRALGAATTSAIQGTLILLLAPFIGVTITGLMILWLLPMIWLVALALTAIGMVLAAWFDNQEGFQFVVNFVNMPMFFLSGALFPLAQLPSWMEVLVRLNPASYAVDGLRRIVLHQQGIATDQINQFSFTVLQQQLSITVDVVILATFAGVLLVVATHFFNRAK